MIDRNITVKYSGRFPVDMLRFEMAYPVGPQDASIIEQSIIDGTGTHSVNIYVAGRTINPKRWHSFNAKVFQENEEITEIVFL